MGEERNKTVKLYRLERSMEESLSTFQSVVEAEKWNGGPQEKQPLEENGNIAIRPKQEQGMDKVTKRRKWVEIHPIDVGVEAREYVCGKNPKEKGVMGTGKKVYRPPLLSTYKET